MPHFFCYITVCQTLFKLFTSEQPKEYILCTCQKICDILQYHLEKLFIRFGSKSYGFIVGIPMETNCAPHVVVSFVFVMREMS